MFSDRGHELYTKSFKLSFQIQTEGLTNEDPTRSRPSLAGRPSLSVSVLCRTLTGRTSCALSRSSPGCATPHLFHIFEVQEVTL